MSDIPASTSAVSKHAGLSCPACRVDLLMSERQGIEIDYCPKCRGVWLDRGELDKIIERSAVESASSAPPQAGAGSFQPSQPAPAPYPPGTSGGSWGDYGHGDRGHGGHGRRRQSFLSNLFD